MNLAGHEISERDLIGRALSNMEPIRGHRHLLRWAVVAYRFGVGSTVAAALCREFCLDPDEEIKR